MTDEQIVRQIAKQLKCKNCGETFTCKNPSRQKYCTQSCASMFFVIPTIERVISKIGFDRSSGCWIFGGHTVGGYGYTRDRGKNVRVHRFMFEEFRGRIRPEFQLDHLCRNRACCNPWHLEQVTPKENTRRGNGPCGINAMKKACSKCGGEYTEINGRRWCIACRRTWQRTHKRTPRAHAEALARAIVASKESK